MERSLERAIRSSAGNLYDPNTAGWAETVGWRDGRRASPTGGRKLDRRPTKVRSCSWKVSATSVPRHRPTTAVVADDCRRAMLQAGPPGRQDRASQRPAANLLRHGCAKVAERIRASMGVTAGEAGPRQRAATAMPWVGLLLWALACAALFVSLIMRTDDLDRDRRVAVRGEGKASISAPAYPMRAVMGQAGGSASSARAARQRAGQAAAENSNLSVDRLEPDRLPADRHPDRMRPVARGGRSPGRSWPWSAAGSRIGRSSVTRPACSGVGPSSQRVMPAA